MDLDAHAQCFVIASGTISGTISVIASGTIKCSSVIASGTVV